MCSCSIFSVTYFAIFSYQVLYVFDFNIKPSKSCYFHSNIGSLACYMISHKVELCSAKVIIIGQAYIYKILKNDIQFALNSM